MKQFEIYAIPQKFSSRIQTIRSIQAVATPKYLERHNVKYKTTVIPHYSQELGT